MTTEHTPPLFTFKDIEQVEIFAQAQLLVHDVRYGKSGRALDYFKHMDMGQSLETVALGMELTFMDIYDRLHSGRSEYNKKEEVDGITKKFQKEYLTTPEKLAFNETFKQFASQLYNDNGSPKKTEEPHKALLELYQDLKKTALYDTDTTFGVFAVMMNYSDKLKETFPNGINFARSTPGAPMEQRFVEAVSNKPLPVPEGEYSRFMSPPGKRFTPEDPAGSTYVEIAGLRFATCQVRTQNHPDWQHGETHLVLKSGQLINLTNEVRERIRNHIESRLPLQELTFAPEGNHSITQYIRVPQRPADAKEPPEVWKKITDIAEIIKTRVATLNSSDPVGLVCLDEDKLTGLRMDAVPVEPGSDVKVTPIGELKKFMSENGFGGFVDLLKGADKHPQGPEAHIQEKIQAMKSKASSMASVGDSYPTELMNACAGRLEIMLNKAFEASQENLKGRHGGVENPIGIIPVGVSGSGKSGVTKIMKKKAGDDGFVVVSLDDGRYAASGKEGLEYWLTIATENHHYDYKDFTEFGELVRAITFHRAVEGRYNVLWDGSGIPWEGKNALAAKVMDEAGYEVSAYKTSTPFYLVDAEGNLLDNVTTRLGWRGVFERRFVPLDVVIRKLEEEIVSFENAKKDQHVRGEKEILDTANIDYTPYPMIVKATITREQIDDMEKLVGKNGDMHKDLLEKGIISSNVPWPLGRNADFKVTGQKTDDEYKIDIIPNVEHYVRDMQKILLNYRHLRNSNLSAEGPETMLVHRLSFDVNGEFQTPEGRLKIEPGETQKSSWPPYQSLVVVDRQCDAIPFNNEGLRQSQNQLSAKSTIQV